VRLNRNERRALRGEAGLTGRQHAERNPLFVAKPFYF
jgi:hypothetical protein